MSAGNHNVQWWEKAEAARAEVLGPAPVRFPVDPRRNEVCDGCGHPKWRHGTLSGECNECERGAVCRAFVPGPASPRLSGSAAQEQT